MEKESYLKQLADYIEKNLAKGYTIESLKIALENQDYSKISIENAIRLANENLAKKAPKMEEKPVIRYSLIEHKDDQEDTISKTKEGFLKKIFK